MRSATFAHPPLILQSLSFVRRTRKLFYKKPSPLSCPRRSIRWCFRLHVKCQNRRWLREEWPIVSQKHEALRSRVRLPTPLVPFPIVSLLKISCAPSCVFALLLSNIQRSPESKPNHNGVHVFRFLNSITTTTLALRSPSPKPPPGKRRKLIQTYRSQHHITVHLVFPSLGWPASWPFSISAIMPSKALPTFSL